MLPFMAGFPSASPVLWHHSLSQWWEGLIHRSHAMLGDTVLHAEGSLNYICIEKCLPSVCSSPGTTQMWLQVF